jgi:hypothetical protein
MFRTAFSVAVIGILAWIAIRIVFGVAGGVVGMLISLCWLVFKLLLVAGLVYWVVSVFSPDTARKWREALRGQSL